MVIDFHVHGKITSGFPFDETKFIDMIKEAQENGLDSIALVEHAGAVNFEEGYNFLNESYNQIEDYYDVNGIKVFYGTEVTTKQDLDILFIGKPKLILEFRNTVNKTRVKNEFIDINDLFNLDIPQEFLVILAHPYREHDVFPELSKKVIDRIDATEFNSKDLYKQGKKAAQEKVLKHAKKLNLPIVSGSDSHYFIQVSTARNIFNKNCENIKNIKEEIKMGRYSTEFSSDLNVRVRSAIIIKDLICNK